MDRHDKGSAHQPTPDRDIPRGDHVVDPAHEPMPGGDTEANPPHTTTGKVTSPKFGSAGSGGLELEPGPPRP